MKVAFNRPIQMLSVQNTNTVSKPFASSSTSNSDDQSLASTPKSNSKTGLQFNSLRSLFTGGIWKTNSDRVAKIAKNGGSIDLYITRQEAQSLTSGYHNVSYSQTSGVYVTDGHKAWFEISAPKN